MEEEPKGWYSRRYLPHFDGGEIPQSVTFHLADSLPSTLLERWRNDLALLAASEAEQRLRKRIEEYLDAGHGEALLRHSRIAAMVVGALLFFDGERYRLHAWVVMPNHVNALFTPLAPFSMARILHSWKSYTSHEANRILVREGNLWFPESFDRHIRDGVHFANAVSYIEHNPAKAGLCARPDEWPWSSASWERRRPTCPPRPRDV